MLSLDSRAFRAFPCAISLVFCACSDDGPAGAARMDAGSMEPSPEAGVEGGSADAGAPFVCDVVAPSACPEPPVTYETVEPIISQRCVGCHDGRSEQWPLTDYGDVVDWYDAIRSMMLDCSMPPPDAGVAMPTSEREHILTWIRCGYPR